MFAQHELFVSVSAIPHQIDLQYIDVFSIGSAGTPVQAYNESGKLKWESELDIYGKVRTSEGDKALIPFRYQGQYEETGLYYNRFRQCRQVKL